MTKFQSQGLHIIKIKYWKAGGSGNPPSLPHSYPLEHWHFTPYSKVPYNKLAHPHKSKHATLGKQFGAECKHLEEEKKKRKVIVVYATKVQLLPTVYI